LSQRDERARRRGDHRPEARVQLDRARAHRAALHERALGELEAQRLFGLAPPAVDEPALLVGEGRRQDVGCAAARVEAVRGAGVRGADGRRAAVDAAAPPSRRGRLVAEEPGLLAAAAGAAAALVRGRRVARGTAALALGPGDAQQALLVARDRLEVAGLRRGRDARARGRGPQLAVGLGDRRDGLGTLRVLALEAFGDPALDLGGLDLVAVLAREGLGDLRGLDVAQVEAEGELAGVGVVHAAASAFAVVAW